MADGGLLTVARELIRDPSLLSSLLELLGGTVQKEEEKGEVFEKKEETGEETEGAGLATLPIDTPTSVLLPPPEAGHGRHGRELLCAVKPYVSPGRCNMIDRILHTLTLVELLRSAKR